MINHEISADLQVRKDRLHEMQERSRKGKIEHFRKRTALEIAMQIAIHQMNAPLRETAAAIQASSCGRCSICAAPMMVGLTNKDRCDRCERAGKFARVQASERKGNIKALKGWLYMMAFATLVGLLIGYLAK